MSRKNDNLNISLLGTVQRRTLLVIELRVHAVCHVEDSPVPTVHLIQQSEVCVLFLWLIGMATVKSLPCDFVIINDGHVDNCALLAMNGFVLVSAFPYTLNFD